MSLKIGIVGLPNAGKSTLFNALLKKQQAQAENRPFTTIEPNVGVVDVPDDRLARLTQIANPEKIIPATIEFVDIAGLMKGAAQGAGLGNKFLSHIREVDAIIVLLRGFEDDAIIHTEGRVDPVDDLKILETELGLADVEHPDAPPLMKKPRLVVENVSEGQLKEKSPHGWLRISAKLEAELAELPVAEQKPLLDELGVRESPLNRVIRESYQLLGLHTFFTAGPKEVRAWTIKQGATAPEAAGAIHTDFEKGFIKAEVISFADYIAHQGEQGARAAGKWRVEGKDYIVADGDVMHIRFNV
ncbi:YchF family ATPase [Candidatus Berkelbacteria bacterium]|nr:YchF family ATPase [Candidatus Berkelbacteria bacterium]